MPLRGRVGLICLLLKSALEDPVSNKGGVGKTTLSATPGADREPAVLSYRGILPSHPHPPHDGTRQRAEIPLDSNLEAEALQRLLQRGLASRPAPAERGLTHGPQVSLHFVT